MKSDAHTSNTSKTGRAIRHIQPMKQPVKAQIDAPGSKSYTNRALVMAALSNHTVELSACLESDDTIAMRECLRRLGYGVEQSRSTIKISPRANARAEAVPHTGLPAGQRGQNQPPSACSETDSKTFPHDSCAGGVSSARGTIELNCRDSGTTIRFLTALACLLPGSVRLTGSKRLMERPIAPLIAALRMMGAVIETGPGNAGPITIHSERLKSHEAAVDGSVSSQFISAILMIGPAAGGLTLRLTGKPISRPYIEMTIGMMADWGVPITQSADLTRFVVPDLPYSRDSYRVEGDYSSAGYFFGLAALTGSTITVGNLNPRSRQADRKFLEILRQYGAAVAVSEQSVTVTGGSRTPLTVDMEDCPDQVQTLAVLAAFAPGVTTISGVKSLRVKETERVLALQNELSAMGIQTQATENTLTIYGGSPHAAAIHTYRDHRMAMSFALAGAVLPNMRIVEPSVVEKTFPAFWDSMAAVGLRSSEIVT